MDTAKWPQEFVVKPMNEIVTNTCLVERKARPEKDQALNCPRCNSLNTKFCYYNNYSLTQPRYFCKDCRRYWTEGGSLRNIPIGGGVRKNKRSSSNSSSSSSKKPLFVNNNTPPPPLNPKDPHEAAKVQDLAFSQGFGIGLTHPSHHQSIPEFLTSMKNNNPLVSTSSALELLGISNSSTPRPPFLHFPNVHDSSSNYTAGPGFGLCYPQFQEFMRPALGFSLDGGGYGGDPLRQEEGSTATNNGRPLLPFESLKLPVSSSSTTNCGGNGNEKEDGEADQSAGFWNGMLSAGASGGTGSWQ